ncbi:2-oxoisovalerate dehydrogenase E1 component [Halopolyspora algeriensis]|uniref:2-oxoisovalerate dehydrogenase E1 component n=1 Tax=Halopolyspora algeriensis TaxID=1500506 RepID=A0A368VCN6_9ACTN|nr:thiamine pyrophosphate-dependent enzyme [Halopolyspora algeriensis]RCW38453.1 2-oxoisovalerate dehydrogenase E1 component [Halopolyspora algeriensis]TQM55768.1 2-oxoisovalerate dehydrogenase E1 component [Halopolyspora algeriensis]
MTRAGERSEAIDEHFLHAVSALSAPARTEHRSPTADPDSPITGQRLLELFEAQAGSRHLDFAARQLGARGLGYYSIGSSGHESNAAVAAALTPQDPALLHYRSGAFYLQRARQVPEQNPLLDVLLGVVASADEPISAGRHKVFGNAALGVIPQTSTIASHLPRSVGLAFSLGRAATLGAEHVWAPDSVVVCSFGDASANHSTATGAINTALHCTHQGLPMPLLLVCEDNGIGISVRTPPRWIETTYGQRPGLAYFTADGDDPVRCAEVARHAADWVRSNRAPAFLHLRTVRLMGHAGSDVESGYRGRTEITADYERDPVLATAKTLVHSGVLTAEEVVRRYEDKRREVARLTEQALARPKLSTAAEVTASITADRPDAVARRATSCPDPQRRRAAFGTQPPESEGPLTVAQSLNRCLADELARDEGVLLFGQDIARKGGVYGVTRGLRKKFGGLRVFDTLLDEQSILGTALGAGPAGLLPIPEIQYLAYLHNAADQLRGEASTLSFFSGGQYRNPMVVRVAGYAYQKGFGGHFHNDNSVAALRDMPGVVVASPSRPDDAAAMLRTCAAAAREDGRVCVFLEPIALYHTRDLHESGDGGWLAGYPAPGTSHVPIGRARAHGDGADLTLVTFGNGLPMSLRVARRLGERGIGARVLDLRWLAPLPSEDLLEQARATGRVLVADETRRSGGVSESVVTALIDAGFSGPIRRVTSQDSFIPLGDAAQHVLLDETTIEQAALAMV